MYVIGAVLLVLFAGFAFTSFNQALTPYVSYTEARAADRPVQVSGELFQQTSAYDPSREALMFTLEDPESGETLKVRYHGPKPANFDEAISIVAIGNYNRGEDTLVAEKLLVKCPSKYQGAEVEEKTYG
jgi:cytochrome c-type biogenesis protein CcmE